jgi:hypothetical protein
MYQRDAPVDTLDLHLPCSCLVHPNQHHPCCHWCIHSPVPPPIPTTSPPPPRKEQLWPYIREFSDNALTHVCKTLTKLAAAGEACELYDIHGHYADAGEAAALMSYTLGVDMVLTGHSLGRNKLDHLLKSGEGGGMFGVCVCALRPTWGGGLRLERLGCCWRVLGEGEWESSMVR